MYTPPNPAPNPADLLRLAAEALDPDQVLADARQVFDRNGIQYSRIIACDIDSVLFLGPDPHRTPHTLWMRRDQGGILHTEVEKGFQTISPFPVAA